MNDVKIIFAPQFEPFQPYLSLPYLKELLRLYNIPSSYIDCNVDFYNWLFAKKKELLNCESGQETYLSNHIGQAVSYIKTGTTDLSKYRWAISVIETYFQAISTDKFSISLSNFEIENKYDADSIKDFVFTNDSLVHRYFDENYQKIVTSQNNYYFFSLSVLEQLPASLVFANEIKKKKTNVKIAFGGAFIARFFKKLQLVEWITEIVDYILPEEGYISVAKIFNITQLYTGHVSPDYSEIDPSQYLSSNVVFPYIISHGCKWGKCAFCAHHLSYSKYQSSFLSDVVTDIRKIQQQYDVNHFSFSDEYLTKEQLEDLCSLLEAEQITIKWSTFARGESYFKDATFTKKLYANGCRILFFGFETFSQKLLNSMIKGTNASNYLPILESCKKSNIAVRIDLMFGFPTETSHEAQEVFETVVGNAELFDTPFSSTAIALFELKEDTPIFDVPGKYGITLGTPCRGNLDEIHNFSPHMQHSAEWRERLMRFFKQEMDSEIIAPYNKTHQLVLKTLYDEHKIIPMPILTYANIEGMLFKLHSSVQFLKNSSQYILLNFANGCEISIAENLGTIIEKMKNGDVPYSSLFNEFFPILNDSNKIFELLSFLYRSDFVVVTPKKEGTCE